MAEHRVGARLAGVLADGNAVEVTLVGDGTRSVWVDPASGDTVRVEYRLDSGAPWRTWDKGDVTGYADDVLDGSASDLRFTRVGGTGTTSSFGVA